MGNLENIARMFHYSAEFVIERLPWLGYFYAAMASRVSDIMFNRMSPAGQEFFRDLMNYFGF